MMCHPSRPSIVAAGQFWLHHKPKDVLCLLSYIFAFVSSMFTTLHIWVCDVAPIRIAKAMGVGCVVFVMWGNVGGCEVLIPSFETTIISIVYLDEVCVVDPHRLYA